MAALNDGYAAAFLLAGVLALVTAILAATQLHSVEPRSTSWEDTESTVDEAGELVGAGR